MREQGDKRDANLARSSEDWNGYLSKSAKKKLKMYIEAMINGKKWQQQQRKQSQKANHCFTFCTLTLSDYQGDITDNFVKKKMLGWFLARMRDTYFLKNYLWKAEKQDNGNVHFHIIMDVAIHWRKIRDLWNRIQDYYGFLNRYQAERLQAYPERKFRFFGKWKKRGKITSVQEQRKYFENQRKRDFKDANSTDIHSLQGVKDVASYITKEFTSDKQAGIGGRLWNCSDKLKQACYYAEEVEFSEYKDFYEELVRKGQFLWENDFACVISLHGVKLPEELRCRVEAHYSNFVN